MKGGVRGGRGKEGGHLLINTMRWNEEGVRERENDTMGGDAETCGESLQHRFTVEHDSTILTDCSYLKFTAIIMIILLLSHLLCRKQ